MEAQSVLLHSKTAPFRVGLASSARLSPRHFNKHLVVTSINHSRRSNRCQNSIGTNSNHCFLQTPLSSSPKISRTELLPRPKCSVSDTIATTSPEPEPETNPFLKPLENLSLDSLRASLSRLTPRDVIKWAAVASIAISAAKWTVNGLLNPFFWMYFSWSWMFWPWAAAVSLAAYGLYCLRRHTLGQATLLEQLAVVTSAFAWLTLVPPAHFNGFLEGWPFVFFFAYHYFFFFNVSVRKRLYGDYYPRPHDPKWDLNLPRWKSLLFCLGVLAGHWLAAFEGPELHTISGGLSSVGVWALIVVALLVQYNATLYLANHSERVVVPSTVVQFGPFRWVRHPIYASTMLMFATYCAAIRAPFSMLFVVGVCLWYYDQKAKLEEGLMVETFRDRYVQYATKVRYKFIPFVY